MLVERARATGLAAPIPGGIRAIIKEGMRVMYSRGGRRFRWLAVALVALAFAAAPAIAQAPTAPINDNYLNSLELNKAGTPLDRVDTLVDHRDTTLATVQPDIFSPPNHGGPAEVTGCAGQAEGHTIWYDFYPDASGLVRIRTSGFDTIMAVMPFSTSTLVPDASQRQCVVNLASNTQELFANVQKGVAYTVQIGGVGNEAGPLEFLFDYVVAAPKLQADATAALLPQSGGVQVVKLTVKATKGSKVQVTCSRGCRSVSRTASKGTVTFPGLAGVQLSAGTTVKIFVTKKNSVGAFIVYHITRGNFSKSQRCLKPNTKTPEACP
jgi:hypothetical protein